MRNGILIAFALTLLALFAGCDSGTSAAAPPAAGATPVETVRRAPEAAYTPAGPEIAEYRAKGLPMLLDFGMGKCIPCKKMAPDLAQLHEELAGKILVRFNELRSEQDLARQYSIRVMPTQVYVDAAGNEVFRHEGYASKAAMMAKMRDLGFLE